MSPSYCAPTSKDDQLLLAKIKDAIGKVGRSRASALAFLDPRQQQLAEQFLQASGVKYEFFGGYEGAQRKRLYLFDDKADVSYGIAAVELTASGFRQLSHRDYLGAVLGLQIDRSKIGDILPHSEGAVLFAVQEIAAFIAENLTMVGRDGVKCRLLAELPQPSCGENFEKLRAVVTTPRLDSVCAALANLSREQANKLIAAERVSLNYRVCCERSAAVSGGDIISVKGIGKFVIESIDGVTKKGRTVLLANRYK